MDQYLQGVGPPRPQKRSETPRPISETPEFYGLKQI